MEMRIQARQVIESIEGNQQLNSKIYLVPAQL